MVEDVKTKMGELFRRYKERFDFLSSNSSMGEHMESEVTSPNNRDNDFLNDYYNVDTTSSYETETELDRYLREPKIELRKDCYAIIELVNETCSSFSGGYVFRAQFEDGKVYEKEAEVVRMYKTLLGSEGFRKGTDLYFQRHEGKAVTCEDFFAAMNIVEGKESRIGKQPIEVPSNVVITLEGQDMKVEGTLGELAVSYSHKMMIDM
ncbi:puromycin-sensitive aminopeptidase-like protein isoform X2 [Tanacetum coccineum]